VGTWEVDLVQVPEMRIEGIELAGLFVVAEASGRVRMATPVRVEEELGPLLLDAALKPMNGAPGRPVEVWLRGELLNPLGHALAELGAKPVVQATLPAVDEMTRSLSSHLQEVGVIAVSHPELWQAPFHRLLASLPWQLVHEEVVFSLHGVEALNGFEGMVVGFHGERAGIMLFPTPYDRRAFFEMDQQGLPFRIWRVCVEPVQETAPDQVLYCEQAGLERDGQVLLVFERFVGGSCPLPSEEERVCVAALDALLQAFEVHQGALVDGETTMVARTALGPVVVRTVVEVM
jgi:hypothetical protein